MSTSYDEPPPEVAPDSSFAETVEDASQPLLSNSQDHEQLADSSFASMQDPDDDTLGMGGSTAQDGGRHPKARRKRTQAKDKTVLEEAYARDPKPNKETRLAIVQRVSLNEREVQIWFQNRRQNDRRKSRPLSPHELSQLKFAKSGVPMISDPRELQDMSDERHPVSDPAPISSAMLSSSPYARPSTSLQGLSDNARPTSLRGHVRSFSDASSRVDGSKKGDSVLEAQTLGPISSSHSFSGTVGWLANRRNLGNSVTAPFFRTPKKDESSGTGRFQSSPSSSQESPMLSESQSTPFIRLRHSLDGQAQLVSADSSPSSAHASPELPEPRQQRTLQRSLTERPPIRLPSFSTLTEGLPNPIPTSQVPRLARGRSRDVHAWESCADADTQDELIALAERESNGSAVAAISIIRSSSNALQPSGSSKRNASMSRGHASHVAKKSRLSRATSSTARLESIAATSLSNTEDQFEKKEGLEKIAVTSLLGSPSDSDKENLTPDEDGNVTQHAGRHRRRRPLPSDGPRSPRRQHAGLLQALPANRPGLLQERALAAPTRKRGRDVSIFEDSAEKPRLPPGEASGPAPESASDVEKFMQGQVSPSKKGDLDCVAGLLSLSQGAWR